MDRDLAAGRTEYAPRSRPTHKLDPYKGIIEARLAAFPKLSAQRLFDEVRAAGYEGSYGLESAFERFGGVPAELLFDQMRAVVLSDDRSGGGELASLPAGYCGPTISSPIVFILSNTPFPRSSSVCGSLAFDS